MSTNFSNFNRFNREYFFRREGDPLFHAVTFLFSDLDEYHGDLFLGEATGGKGESTNEELHGYVLGMLTERAKTDEKFVPLAIAYGAVLERQNALAAERRFAPEQLTLEFGDE